MQKKVKIILGIFLFSIFLSSMSQVTQNVNAISVNASFESDSEFLTYVSDYQTPNLVKENPSEDNDYRIIYDDLTMNKMPELTGIFPATYTFTDLSDSTAYQIPTDWTDENNHQSGQNVNITDWLDHDNVVGLWDTNQGNSIELAHSFSTPQTVLTSSFWIYTNTIPSTQLELATFFTSTGTIALMLLLAYTSGAYYVQYGHLGVWSNAFSVPKGEWLYFNITVNCVTDKWICDVNNVNKGTFDLHNSGNFDNVKKFRVGTSDTNNGAILTYYDSIEFSCYQNPAVNQQSTEEYSEAPFLPLFIATETEGSIDYLQRCYTVAQFAMHNISVDSFTSIYAFYSVMLTQGEDPIVVMLYVLMLPDSSISLNIFCDYYSVSEQYNVPTDYNWTSMEINMHVFITNIQRYAFKIECRLNQQSKYAYVLEYILTENTGNSETYFYPYSFGVQLVSEELSVENPLDCARFLKSVDNVPVSSFSNVGYILQDIFVPSFPDPNEGRPYWVYLSWNVTYDNSEEITVGNNDFNYTYTFNLVRSELIESIFYYNSETIVSSTWGTWGIWGEWNWLRDLIVITINTILTFFQFIFYLVWSGVNLLLFGLVFAITIPFFWNFLIYWIYFGLNQTIAFTISTIIIIGENLPYLIMFVAGIFAYVVAALIWVVTLGTIPFDTILNTVLTMSQSIATQLTSMLFTFFDSLPAIVGYAGFYMILLSLAYVKYIYVKARGFVNRAEQCRAVYDSYLSVIKTGQQLVNEVKGLIL